MSPGTPQVHRFGTSVEPKRFAFGDDDFIFEAAPDLPAQVLELIPLLTKLDPSAGMEGVQPLFDFMREVLQPGSVEEFERRLGSKDKTFGITSIRQVIPWLLEEYGLRPTQQSSLSQSASSGETGMSLTDGASLAAPTP